MRLRKQELVFIGITLAFVFFISGFFVGRNFNQITVEEISSLRVETTRTPDVQEVQNEPAGNETNASVNMNINTNTEVVQLPVVEPGMPTGGDGRININTASRNELMDLPGIGPALADSIIEYRNNHGAFRTIEDIMNVSGIAQGRFDRIKDRISV